MSADLPFVSVIIPVYNESGFIEDCLRAFQRQTYPSDRMEILVVDGMSTDGCREEIAGVIAVDPRVRLIDNPRRVAAGRGERRDPGCTRRDPLLSFRSRRAG